MWCSLLSSDSRTLGALALGWVLWFYCGLSGDLCGMVGVYVNSRTKNKELAPSVHCPLYRNRRAVKITNHTAAVVQVTRRHIQFRLHMRARRPALRHGCTWGDAALQLQPRHALLPCPARHGSGDALDWVTQELVPARQPVTGVHWYWRDQADGEGVQGVCGGGEGGTCA